MPPPDASARVAFCQDCGRPLTAETVRAVGTGVFCEPCLMARVSAQNGVPNYAGVPPAGYPASPLTGPAHPVLAGFLGVIPGVGAMYNGQYSKGFAHLIVFVLLDSISKNVSHIFDVFAIAWVVYQIFDAYHTAKARNEGLPLPNVFGLNDIGEKMGFGKTWGFPGHPHTPPNVATPPPPAAAAWQPPPPPAGPIPSGPDWVGYVPPTNFASTAAQQAQAYTAAVHQQAYRDAGFAQPPPGETFTGAGVENPYAVPPLQPLTPEAFVARRRFPVGAFWLIGLGVLILFANLIPDWKITEPWWPVIVFAGLSITIFLRRLRSGARWIAIVRAPVIFLVLAIMFALHAANLYVNFGVLFAVLFIIIGALLLLERTIGLLPTYGTADTTRASFVPHTAYAVAPQPPVGPQDDATKGDL